MSAHHVTQVDPTRHTRPQPRTGSALAVGSILIGIGILAALARAADVDLDPLIGDQTWPVLVILPGLALLGVAVVRTPPEGLGFAIAGSIVTTVGAILLVQANTDTWESWAYVWALIPGAAGLAMTVYGLLTRTGELVDKGTRMVLIAGVLYLAGWWYFDTLFTTGEQPIDLHTWWPLALIGVGALIATRALVGSRRRPTPDATTSDIEGGTRT